MPNIDNLDASERRHPARTVAGFLFGSVAAWLYLALVAASVVFTVIALTVAPSDDANFAAVWPLFATMPWSLILISFVPELSQHTGGLALIGIVVVSALANLATIGALMHVIRHAPEPRPYSRAARPIG